jgi:hypothetical protein
MMGTQVSVTNSRFVGWGLTNALTSHANFLKVQHKALCTWRKSVLAMIPDSALLWQDVPYLAPGLKPSTYAMKKIDLHASK